MPDLTAGWEIIILGTGTVFVALIGLGIIVTVLYKLFGPKTPITHGVEPQGEEKQEGKEVAKEDPPVAAIAAAIHAFRGDGKFRIVRIRHQGEEWARRGRQELINNKPEWKGS